MGLLILAFGLGVGLARIGGRMGWPRPGGYLGLFVIAAVLTYTLGVYGYRAAPRAAALRALNYALWLIGALMCADVVKLALR